MSTQTSSEVAGELFLVSAGIGDADNLTLKVLKTVQRADLVFAMQFVAQQLADYLPEGVEVINPGHGLFTPLARNDGDPVQIKQHEESIRQQVRSAVAAGKCVVVVEFGDPTLFGPQVGYLEEFRNLKPVVLPGISSFNAANALLCQPLLHRGSQRLMMTTVWGMEGFTGTPPDVLVLFTMKLELLALSDLLLQHYPAETAVALVFAAGFTGKEQVVHLNLDRLAEDGAALDIPWACLIYVGAINAV
jgi:siroheme synthase